MGALITQRLGLSIIVDGADHAVTVVAGHCVSGAGSPPSAVFSVVGTGSGAALAQTLVAPDAQILVTALTLVNGRVELRGQGYSGPDVPRCCPDRTIRIAWAAGAAGLVRVV
jgi:hypothetical protein